MTKQSPGFARIALMVGFALSVFAVLTYLWVSFGGVVPLAAQDYRVKIAFPQAALLADEGDVRISGINVGHVKSQELMKQPPRNVATLSIDARYAPLPADTRAILRQKTLLGETYVELTPGTASGPIAEDGTMLPLDHVEPTVELDEIYQTFDRPTRRAFRNWLQGSSAAIRGRAQDLNFAFANLPGFLDAGEDVLSVLRARDDALQRLVRNTGVVFAALNERQGALRDLIVNSNRLFATTARNDDALARTIEIFPTFLEESRATLARLERFAVDTRPLVRDLRPVARDLGPTVRDLGDLAPDLADLFDDVDALADVAPRTMPAAARFLRGAAPLFEGLHVFLPELNPILSYANFNAVGLAEFFTVGAAATAGTLPRRAGDGHPRHYLRQMGIINTRSLALNETRPPYERANAYIAPNAWLRMRPLGVLESFTCAPAGGRKPQPTEGEPPCFVSPPSLWDGNLFPLVELGKAPLVRPPRGNEGTEPARP